jgi:TPR repeat protein
MHMKFAAVGLSLSCAVLAAADKSIESGFLDSLGIAKSKVIEKVLPETLGAKCHREGMVLRYSQPLDSDKAFKLFLQGYEAGNASCAYELSLCYLNGIGVRRSQSKALDALAKGMQMKDGFPIDCELKWISMHMGDILSLYDEAKARVYVQRLAQLSSRNAVAAAMLTKYTWVEGNPPVEMVSAADHLKAVESLKSMAAAGDPYASFEYGKILLGPGPIRDANHPKYVAPNVEEGLKLVTFAASKGVQGSHYRLHEYFTDKDVKPSTAFEWLEKGWAAGDCKSGYSLSYALIRGKGTAVDKKRAVEVALKVGEQGSADQVYNIADFFTGYTGFDASLSNFITWHRVAADRGNSDSADQLGKIYAGEEVIGFKVTLSASPEDAFKYFKMGAYPDGEHNFVYRLNSLLYLGDMYRRGIGCEADPSKAAKAYLDYLAVFRNNDYSKNQDYQKGGKARMIWLKRHYPNLPGVAELGGASLKFDGFADCVTSFNFFAKYDFDYELFDEIAAVVKSGDREEKNTFQRACDFVERSYGVSDALFYFGDLEYGEDFNSNSYEWYKYAALSGSPSAAYRLHDMLYRQSGKKNTLNAGPEYALKLSMGRTASQLVIALGEDAAWRKFAVYLEENFNSGRAGKTRDFSKIASGPLSIMAQYGSTVEAQNIEPILRMIHEAHREQLAKNRARR